MYRQPRRLVLGAAELVARANVHEAPGRPKAIDPCAVADTASESSGCSQDSRPGRYVDWEESDMRRSHSCWSMP